MYQHLSTMHQQMVTFVKKYADFSGFYESTGKRIL